MVARHAALFFAPADPQAAALHGEPVLDAMKGHERGTMDKHAGSVVGTALPRAAPMLFGDSTLVLQYLVMTARHLGVLREPPPQPRSVHGLPTALWKNGHVRGSMLQQAGSREWERTFL